MVSVPVVRVPPLHRLVCLPRGRAADPPRRNRMVADRGPGRGEGHPAGKGPAGRCHHCGAGHGEGRASFCRANGPPGVEAGGGAGPLMAEVRPDVHELPTLRSMAPSGCMSGAGVPSREGCRSRRTGRRRPRRCPLVQIKWRCGNRGSRLTEFIVGRSHGGRANDEPARDTQHLRELGHAVVCKLGRPQGMAKAVTSALGN